MSLTGGSKFILTGGATNYQIARSLRFRASNSAYLSRTPGGAGNRKTWTLSVWLKGDAINGGCILGAGTTATTDSNFLAIEYGTGEIRLTTAATLLRASTQQFRDPSAWWNLVVKCDTTQATAADRLRLYANNVEITAWSTNVNLAQNTDTAVNWTEAHNIGRRATGTGPLDGYIAEMYVIDGQQLTPSSFGQTDASTGAWNPIKYTGTYGTNGFYLPFSDNSAATAATIGKDSSGNGNNWTPSGISITAGVTNDSLVDTPTNYGSDTGAGGEVRGNYATLSPLDNGGGTLSNGNLKFTYASPAHRACRSAFALTTADKFYWEETIGGSPGGSSGIMAATASLTSYIGDTGGYGYHGNGNRYYNGSTAALGATYTSGDIISYAWDGPTGTLTAYKNGASQGNVITGLTGTYFPAVSSISSDSRELNFGQRPYAYAAPSGFKALCTQNLPDPAIPKPSSYFDIDTYAGTAATRTKTGLGFQPDLVWFKSRGRVLDHALYDSVRGVQNDLGIVSTAEASQATGLTAFNSDGYTTGALDKLNGTTATNSFVSWMWKESVTSGFDIVTYAGDSTTNRNINHSLGVAPKLVIIFDRTTNRSVWTWHTGLAGATYAVYLDDTAAQTNTGSPWGTGNFSSTQFMVSQGTANVNLSGDNYVAYLFAEVAGFSKFGSYTGNGSADGTFVWCGFRPKFVLLKRYDSTSNWQIRDATRFPSNGALNEIYPNLSNAESGSVDDQDNLSNGFKLRRAADEQNASGGTYIFAAFAESPFKTARAR